MNEMFFTKLKNYEWELVRPQGLKGGQTGDCNETNNTNNANEMSENKCPINAR